MALYTFEAENFEGTKVQGTLDAKNEVDARIRIKARELKPIKIEGASPESLAEDLAALRATPFRERELAIFFRGLSSLVSAGDSIEDAFQALQNGLAQERLQKLSRVMRLLYVQHGSLYRSFSELPELFEPVLNSLLQKLDQQREYIHLVANYFEGSAEIEDKRNQTLVYSVSTLALLPLSYLVFMGLIVPALDPILGLSQSEEVITWMFWKLSVLSKFLVYLLPVLFILTFTFRRKLPKLVRQMPIIGRIIDLCDKNQILVLAETLTKAGVPVEIVLDSLAAKSTYYRNEFMQAKTAYLSGGSFADSLASLFNPVELRLLGLKEQLRELPTAISSIREQKEQELLGEMKKVDQTIDPFIFSAFGLLLSISLVLLFQT